MARSPGLLSPHQQDNTSIRGSRIQHLTRHQNPEQGNETSQESRENFREEAAQWRINHYFSPCIFVYEER